MANESRVQGNSDRTENTGNQAPMIGAWSKEADEKANEAYYRPKATPWAEVKQKATDDASSQVRGTVIPDGGWAEPKILKLADVKKDTTTTVDPFLSTVETMYDTAQRILLGKHADYGHKNISEAPGGALNGIRVRLHDKISRINNLIDNGNTPNNESLRDSFMDAANYCLIACMIIDGTWPGIDS